MCRHTTFKIGGPADCFIVPHDRKAVETLLAYCKQYGIPHLALGNGSNLLVSDSGIRSVVISLKKLDSITVEEDGSVSCGAGATLADVCRAARDHSLTGLEFAYGIPGTVGGAVYMNAGAYGGEMKDVVVGTSHVENGVAGSLSGGELFFGYRQSPYTGTARVITGVRIALSAGDPVSISARMEELMARRKSRQPLEYPSAGSVFKRPPGLFAGTLIEQCGLKGTRCGGAMVSEKHANFIINTGGATCADVLALIDKVREEVRRQAGVELECEVKMIG